MPKIFEPIVTTYEAKYKNLKSHFYAVLTCCIVIFSCFNMFGNHFESQPIEAKYVTEMKDMKYFAEKYYLENTLNHLSRLEAEGKSFEDLTRKEFLEIKDDFANENFERKLRQR
jgi:hypothetical protein